MDVSFKPKIIGIGAPAGGMQALEEFFQSVPLDSGVSFFVIQHQLPEHEGILAKHMASHCPLPVIAAAHQQIFEPNTVYVCPPGLKPSIQGNRICFDAYQNGDASAEFPMDAFFRSMADEFGAAAWGVILSGTGTDGSKGSQHVAGRGGRVFVESADETALAGMPESALAQEISAASAPASKLWALIETKMQGPAASDPLEQVEPQPAATGLEHGSDSADSSARAPDQLAAVQQELRLTRARLKAANEELQISNDELQALNEELRVSNEELQGAMEELSANNEELGRVNAEYSIKHEELELLNVSHENLLNSIEDGVLFVDGNGCIQRFNPPIQSAFNLKSSDLGRPLSDIDYKLGASATILAEVKKVLNGESVSEHGTEIVGRCVYIKRITAYHGSDGSISGAVLSFTDITEFSNLQRRFEFAMEKAGTSWWDWDLGTGALSVHSAGECILGGDCSNMPLDREGWMEKVHPEDRAELARTLDAHLNGETEEWHCEHRFRAACGDWLWVKNSGCVLLRDAAGKALSMLGTTQDINDYKLSIISSNAQNDILSAAGEIVKLGAWEYYPESDLITWSEQTRKILAVEDDFEPSAEATYSFFAEREQKMLQVAFENVIANGVDYNLKLRCTNLRGEDLVVRTACRARYDENGKLVRVSGIFQDITKEALAEHEVHAFFDLSMDYQAILEPSGQFLRVNSNWTAALGGNQSALLTRNIQEFIHTEERANFMKAIASALDGKAVQNLETRCHICGTDDGETGVEEWISWSVSYEVELDRVFVSGRDISARKKANMDVQAALVEAKEGSRAKSDFLAVMSHELRTPLNPVLGFAEILLEEVENPEHCEILSTIVDSGEQLIAMINEILDYSKGDSGKLQLDRVEFSLEDLIQSKVRLMSGQLSKSDVSLVSELNPGIYQGQPLPAFVGDVSMLERVIRNLLSNAVKFTDEGTITLSVEIGRVEQDVAAVCFQVADTGIGIDPAQHGKIFEPFTQVHSGSTRKYGGTGLGLSICKQLVEMMGGQIAFGSELGRGSTFSFSVPLQVVQLVNKATRSSPRPEVDKTKRRVLVVEDNESNIFFLDQLLQRKGCEVFLARSGEESLKILAEQSFEIVFLDLHMPGISGFEVLQHIREVEKEMTAKRTTVYILTADVAKETQQRSLELGADGFLTKPLSVARVGEALERAASVKS